MPKIKFTQYWKVQQGDGKGPVYNPGDVADVAFSYAEKYKRRGLAVDYVEPEQVVEPVVDAAPDEPTVIPDDWKDMKGSEMRALASKLVGQPVLSKAEAYTIISDKLSGA